MVGNKRCDTVLKAKVLKTSFFYLAQFVNPEKFMVFNIYHA